MTTHDAEHTRTPNHDIDIWLDVAEILAPGNRNARSFPDDAPVVHLTGPAGDLVLRRWDAGATASRIAFIAEALDAARAATGEIVPPIDPVPGHPDQRSVLVRGNLYTRSPFLPGRRLARYGGYRTPPGETIDVPLHESAGAHTLIADVARTLAQVHAATTELAARKDAPVTTLGSMLAAVRNLWFEQRKVLGDKAASQRDIRRWLRCGNRIIPAASDALRRDASLLADRSVVVHGDIWPGHVLIEGRDDARRITGITGWSSAAAGSPVLDLAALSVHMQGWSAALTEAIVESYSAVTPLAPEQRRLVPVVAALDLVARVAWLLNLSYLDDQMINHPAMPVLRSGMKTLLNSLETLTGILAPEPTTARWVHRRPPSRNDSDRPGPSGPRRYGSPRSGADRPARPGRSKHQRNRE